MHLEARNISELIRQQRSEDLSYNFKELNSANYPNE